MYKCLDFARNSFKEVIKFYGLKQIHIPYYLCDVMRHSAFQTGCKPVFYHINDDFLPEKDFKHEDFILYPNYFGICDKNVDILYKMYPNLVVDNAHSYFSAPKGRACFNSKRKFLEVNSGSDLWIENLDDDRELDKNVMKSRADNFSKINNVLHNTNLLKIDTSVSPFCYPYLAQDENIADETVKKLSGVDVYRYWNELPKSFNEYKFFSRLVPIPIMQDISDKFV